MNPLKRQMRNRRALMCFQAHLKNMQHEIDVFTVDARNPDIRHTLRQGHVPCDAPRGAVEIHVSYRQPRHVSLINIDNARTVLETAQPVIQMVIVVLPFARIHGRPKPAFHRPVNMLQSQPALRQFAANAKFEDGRTHKTRTTLPQWTPRRGALDCVKAARSSSLLKVVKQD